MMITLISIIIGIFVLSIVVLYALTTEREGLINSSVYKNASLIPIQLKLSPGFANTDNISNTISENDSVLPIPPLETISGRVLNEIFSQTQDSVVRITRTVPNTGIEVDPSNENRTALGSGFLIDNQGHIVTNNHVVGDAKIVDVTFTNGDRMRANVTAVDPYIDLAVLRMLETKNNSLNQNVLRPLLLGNSSALSVGDQVIAIGNPYGLAGSMTTGIVSQVARLVPAPNVPYSVPDVIQTDAAINPGNSGGPLLNMEGKVIGVNFAALPQGLGFAIPMNLIQKVLPSLIEKGNYTHPYLGFSGTTLTSDLAANIKNVTENTKGVIVNSLILGGPADSAGLHGTTTDQYGRKYGGDIITGINNENITEFEQLVSFLEGNTRPGDKVVLKVLRNGTALGLDAVMGERPSPSMLPNNN
jgi:S1-C subfamily serine protease